MKLLLCNRNNTVADDRERVACFCCREIGASFKAATCNDSNFELRHVPWQVQFRRCPRKQDTCALHALDVGDVMLCISFAKAGERSPAVLCSNLSFRAGGLLPSKISSSQGKFTVSCVSS